MQGGFFTCRSDQEISMMTFEQLQYYVIEITHHHNTAKVHLEREVEKGNKLLSIINSMAKRGHKHPHVRRIGGREERQEVQRYVTDSSVQTTCDKSTNCPENAPPKDTVRVVADVSSVQMPMPGTRTSNSGAGSPLYTAVRKRLSESELDNKQDGESGNKTETNQLARREPSKPEQATVEQVAAQAQQQHQGQPTMIYGGCHYRFEVIIRAPVASFTPTRSVSVYFASNSLHGAGVLIVGAQNGQPARYYTHRQSHEGNRGPRFWPPPSQTDAEMQTCMTGIGQFRNLLQAGDDVQIWTDSLALQWDHFPPLNLFKSHLDALQMAVGCRFRLFHDSSPQNNFLKVAHLLTTFIGLRFQESPFVLLRSLEIAPGL
jgi:hypothetical protein